MELLPIYIVLGFCLVMKGYSETIQCYKCDDCNKLDDSLLESCPPNPVSPPTSTTEESTTSSTTEESEPTTEEPEPTTEEPENESALAPESISHADLKLEPIVRRTSRQVNYTSLMLRRKRDTASYTYHCYSIQIEDGNKRKTKKDCVEVPENKTPCQVLKDQYGVSEENCKTCSETKCNSSGVLKYSLATFVIVIVIDLFCY